MMRENYEDCVKKCMEFRGKGRRLVRRPIRTYLESVEADMAVLENDGEDVHDKKKCRDHVMKRKSNYIGKQDYKPIIMK